MPILHHLFNALSLLTLIYVMLITCCFSQEKIEKKNKIDFEIHSGYFVSNKFEPKNPQSFIITSDQEFFDSAFGIAFVQGDKSNRLKEGSLKAKIVISTIKGHEYSAVEDSLFFKLYLNSSSPLLLVNDTTS